MIYLKKTFSALLFITAFTATLTIINTVQINRLIRTVEAFEPVVIEQVIEVAPEPEATPTVEPVPTPEPEISPRINCRLDDETQQMILEKCKKYNIDFAFTMAVIFKESSFRPNADSGSSVGLMQINRINHKWLSEELGLTDFFDPEQNVEAGLFMLRQLFEKYEDPALVLMAYNMGETGAKRLWNKGIYSTDYVETVFQQADIYNQEIIERMGEDG